MKSDDYEKHIKEPEWLRQYVTVYDISEVFNEYAQIRCALNKSKKNLDKEQRFGSKAYSHCYFVLLRAFFYRCFENFPSTPGCWF